MSKAFSAAATTLCLALPAWGNVDVYECVIDRKIEVGVKGRETEIYDEAKRRNPVFRHRFALDLEKMGGCVVHDQSCLLGIGRLNLRVVEDPKLGSYVVGSGARRITGGEVRLTFRPFVGQVEIAYLHATRPEPTQTQYLSRTFDCVRLGLKVRLPVR